MFQLILSFSDPKNKWRVLFCATGILCVWVLRVYSIKSHLNECEREKEKKQKEKKGTEQNLSGETLFKSVIMLVGSMGADASMWSDFTIYIYYIPFVCIFWTFPLTINYISSSIYVWAFDVATWDGGEGTSEKHTLLLSFSNYSVLKVLHFQSEIESIDSSMFHVDGNNTFTFSSPSSFYGKKRGYSTLHMLEECSLALTIFPGGDWADCFVQNECHVRHDFTFENRKISI